jgi:cytochrome c oxidase cbb3-type subunit 3
MGSIFLSKATTTPALICAILLSFAAFATAQTPQQPSPPPGAQAPGTQNAAPPTEPPRRGGFVPGQHRAAADPAVISRGKTLYEINCRGCHGPDLRGGDLGGPNLLRSQVALSDLNGEQIVPIIHGSRQSAGMPAIPLNDADANAVAAYVRSVIESIKVQGAPPSVGQPVTSILVGNADEGKSYFAAKCSSCHSTTGDLANIGAKFTDAKRLQNAWLSGGARGGEAEGATATITLSSGQTVEGKLVRVDDFLVTVTLADGSQQTFRRTGDNPKVGIHDPLKPHRDLLSQYTDKDIHDVTAYLVTLK